MISGAARQYASKRMSPKVGKDEKEGEDELKEDGGIELEL